MSEKTDFKTLRQKLPQHKDFIERIENSVGIGTPDVRYCIDGVEGWIEMKSPKEPKKATSILLRQSMNHKLSQSQKNWFLRQRNAGGRAFILICTDKRWMLIDKWQADYVNEMTADELEMESKWSGCKPLTKGQWGQLRKVLCESN